MRFIIVVPLAQLFCLQNDRNHVTRTFQVYFSPNQSYEDRHYHETPYEVSPPAAPVQRHKQLPEIPTKKAPYMDYYSSSYYSEQAPSTKKILPQIPHSRIKPSPSLPQTYQKNQRRTSIEQQHRSSSLDHKDGDEYDYADPMLAKEQFEEYDGRHYCMPDVAAGMRPQNQYAPNSGTTGSANANSEKYDVVQDKKEETEGGFNRRDTFKKFYHRTVKHLENPKSFFQQHTDSAESQEEHKEVISRRPLLIVTYTPAQERTTSTIDFFS